MSLRERRNERWVGAVILIAIGIIGLATNFNLVPPDILSQLWKLWPIIPLIIGISLLMRRQRYLDGQSGHDGPR